MYLQLQSQVHLRARASTSPFALTLPPRFRFTQIMANEHAFSLSSSDFTSVLSCLSQDQNYKSDSDAVDRMSLLHYLGRAGIYQLDETKKKRGREKRFS